MIFCKDCKYHTIPNIGYWCLPVRGLPKCGHPKLLSMVDGKPTSFCSNQREFNSSECGPEAKLFEMK